MRRPKKQDQIERKPFTTNINTELLHKFKIYCVTNNLYQNDVLEKLIGDLLEGSEKVGNTD
ncbi:hypothetical protein FDB61_17920 [Clostridium botulinum]|nr:hypothetical protein [Clostridium botulinum]